MILFIIILTGGAFLFFSLLHAIIGVLVVNKGDLKQSDIREYLFSNLGKFEWNITQIGIYTSFGGGFFAKALPNLAFKYYFSRNGQSKVIYRWSELTREIDIEFNKAKARQVK